MLKSTAALLLILGMLIHAGAAQANDPDEFRRGALKGDYQAQRNHAYVLQHGDGVPANPLEACAWRLVIFSTQGAKLIDSDISNIWMACPSKELMTASNRRAAAIVPTLPHSERSIDGDIRDFTEDTCPGSTCKGKQAAFVSIYKEAMTGKIDAIRQLSQCLSSACAPMGINFFQSCVWSQIALASLGPNASKDDIRHDKRVCEIDRAAARDLAKFHMKSVLQMISQNPAASTR